MRKLTSPTAFLLLAFLAAPIFSLPPTESAHGVIVKFRNASKTTYRSRDQLHSSLGTELVYRPKRSPYDFVLPKSEEQRHDLAALAKLCESYQGTSSVVSCEINFDLFSRNASTACSLSSPAPAKEGELSPFWAQEAIGLDLVAFPRNAVRMGVGVTVGFVDQGFLKTVGKRVQPVVPSPPADNHGALVLGLVSAPLPFSVQAPVVVSHQFEVRHTVDFLKILDTLEESKPAPAILQFAVDLGKQSEVANEVFSRLAKRSLLVAAASGSWPGPRDASEKSFPGILVGSLAPEGLPSLWSHYDQALAVSAPSDRSLLSTLDGITPVSFGGNSGASAMVASVLAAAKSLVPDLELEEVRALLQNTSLPTPASQKGYKGYASLNAVKLLAVADRIRAEGLSGPKRRKALAGGGRLYRFEKEAEKAMEESLPTLQNPGATCEARQKALNQLRRSFFLNPAPASAAALAGVLNENGLKANARFFQSMDPSALTPLLISDLESASGERRANAAKMAALQGAESVELLLKFAEGGSRTPASDEGSTKPSSEQVLESILSGLDPERTKALVQKLKASRNQNVKKMGESLSPSN